MNLEVGKVSGRPSGLPNDILRGEMRAPFVCRAVFRRDVNRKEHRCSRLDCDRRFREPIRAHRGSYSMAHRVITSFLASAAVVLPLTLGGCATLALGAANLIENGNAHSTEIAYGDAARQRYDVFRPVGADGVLLSGPLPVVIFVHGGSWETGDKGSYRWVGQGIAAQGFIAVLPNYGLMPERRFPGFVDDVAQAVVHTRAKLATWGGDTSRVVLMGHSAGAHIAALVAYDARYLAAHGLTPRMLSGFVGLSGPYDFIFDTPRLQRTFSGTPEQEHDALPVHFASSQSPRTLLVMGRDDSTVKPHNTHSLAARLGEVGARFDTLWVDGTHSVSVSAFARHNRGDSEIVRRVREFVLSR